MKKMVLMFTFLLMMVLSCNIAFAGQQDFVLTNRTGAIITEVYVSPTSYDDWQKDVLGNNILHNKYKTKIVFKNGARSTLWDLKVVTENGDELVYTKFNLKKVSQITIRGNGDADYE